MGAPPSRPLDLLDTVRGTIDRHGLLARGERVLVAVSGGPDSVALLHVLWLLRQALGIGLAVGHVHHGLRPESDAEAALVETLAGRLGCPAAVERVVVRPGGGRSPEDAARVARHAALGRLADRAGATRIALGHTADDQAETVLMRVLQGAGPRGLGGMPIRRGRVVRPLLEAGRPAVLAHLARHDLSWVEDPSNQDPRFLRNRIRHEVLPALTALAGPRVPEALHRLARASRETAEALDALLRPRLADLVRPAPTGWLLSVDALTGLPPGAVKALLRLALVERGAPAGLRAPHLDALATLVGAAPGARVRLPGGLRIERGRDVLFVLPAGPPPAPVALRVPGVTRLPATRLVVEAMVEPATPAPSPDAASWAPAWEVRFDADRLPADLALRPWRPGDRITPFGAPRAARVSRFMTAAGVPGLARPGWPVLVGHDAGGETLLWIVGLRRGMAAPLAPGTRSVLRLRARLDPAP